jgi:hypothetical protein
MLYPGLVGKLVVWNIVGGVYGTFVLGSYYVAGQSESGQHTLGVVVGAPADVGDYTSDRHCAESFGAQVQRALLGRIGIAIGFVFTTDEQLHLAAGNRHLPDCGVHHFSAGLVGESKEGGHALV